jgi:hypothetical protein
MLIHGESGAGKSTTADTVPGPRLVLDAEGRAQYTPSGPKIVWNPMKDPPPVYDGTWQTCVVNVTDYKIMEHVYVWLRSGQHPFVSVVVDSLMELQMRCQDTIAGTAQLKTQDWGELLRSLSTLMRNYRDLTLIHENPCQVVVFVTGSRNIEGTMRPMLQGQMAERAPYLIDVVGYLFTVQSVNPDQTPGPLVRQMLTQPQPGFVAKDGTGLLAPIVEIPDPRSTGRNIITELMNTLEQRGKAESFNAEEVPA